MPKLYWDQEQLSWVVKKNFKMLAYSYLAPIRCHQLPVFTATKHESLSTFAATKHDSLSIASGQLTFL